VDRTIPSPDQELLSAEKVAAQMGIGVETFRQLVERKEFPPGVRVSPQKEKWPWLDVFCWCYLRSRGLEFCQIQADPGGSRRKVSET
jgi:predicted DNA-binding transcriptional regulator AlpA